MKRNRSAKITTDQVIAMYKELREGATQSSCALKYGLSVIQVGRIARGESRAQETGARENPILNSNITIRPEDVEASLERMKALMNVEETKAPSLYNDPPPYNETDSTVLKNLQDGIKNDLGTRVGDSLDDFKGD